MRKRTNLAKLLNSLALIIMTMVKKVPMINKTTQTLNKSHLSLSQILIFKNNHKWKKILQLKIQR